MFKNSFNDVLKKYKEYVENDVSIHLEFTDTTIKKISSKIIEMNSTLSKNYINLLNKECKNNFIDSYTKAMNAQTNQMIQTIEDLKLKIKSKIDDLFTVDIEQVLNEANNKMNMTLDSIKEYENYFKSFKLPENLIIFFETYGDTVIQRAYDDLETFINKLTKNETLTHLEKNMQYFHNSLNIDKFIKEKNNTYKTIKNNYIDNITDNINSYGKEDYPTKLADEIYRLQSRRLRRLSGRSTEEDISEEIKEDLNEKSISQNLNKLLIKSEKTLNSIKAFESFDKFNEIIEKDLKKLKVSYREAKEVIDNTYKEDDVYPILNDILENLNQFGINYYDKIKESYNSLRRYLDDSLYEIDQLLNKCTNITYEAIIQKYENISKKSVPFDINKKKNEKKDKEFQYTKSSENHEYEAITKINSIDENARFKYNLVLEGEGRMKEAKVVASVINNIKPKKANIEVKEQLPNCGKHTQYINVDFNTVNYTANLYFDSEYNIMNVSMDKDFIYEFTLQGYEVDPTENGNETLCDSFLDFDFCFDNDECEIFEEIPTNETLKETVIIQENGKPIPLNNIN